MSWGCVGIACNRRAPMYMCVCVRVSINRCQRCPWQAIVAAAAVQGGRGNTSRGDVFCMLHFRLFWLRPGLLPFLFILWRVHVTMALGDVMACLPLVKQGLFVVWLCMGFLRGKLGQRVWVAHASAPVGSTQTSFAGTDRAAQRAAVSVGVGDGATDHGSWARRRTQRARKGFAVSAYNLKGSGMTFTGGQEV